VGLFARSSMWVGLGPALHAIKYSGWCGARMASSIACESLLVMKFALTSDKDNMCEAVTEESG